MTGKRLVVLLFLCLPWWAGAAGPSLILKDLNGASRNVNEFVGQGKWVVVAVWAHNCHYCNQDIHQMAFFHDDHRKRDAIVLGVSVDGWNGRDKARAFVERHALPFPNLIAEPTQDVMLEFGAGMFIGTPTYYIYAPDGELVANNVGPLSQEDIEQFIGEQTAKQGNPKGPG